MVIGFKYKFACTFVFERGFWPDETRQVNMSLNIYWTLIGTNENKTYLHARKEHRCYWLHNKSRRCSTLGLQQILNWNGLVFHWFLCNKRNITWPLKDTKVLFSCWEIFHSFAALTREMFFNKSKRTFVSSRGHVISSISRVGIKVKPSS